MNENGEENSRIESKRFDQVVISDKALVPVGMLAGIIAVVFFLGGFVSEQKAHGESIKRIEERYMTLIDSINTRLATIEGRLSIESPANKK